MMEYIYVNSELFEFPNVNVDTFRCLIVAESRVSSLTRSLISTWIIEQGCQYMLVCGVEADLWEDAFDKSGLALKVSGKRSDANFVISVSYGDENLSEVIWLAKNASFHPSFELGNTFVFHISEGPEDRHRFLKLWNDS